MHQLKTLALATATAGLFAFMPLAAYAEPGDLSSQLSEARQEGSIWTAFALNRHLSPFKIDVDVENGSALLTGSVETFVERDLAEQIALGIEGVNEVDNRLQIDPKLEPTVSSEPTLAQRFDDVTLVATVKSKLLWNSNTEGLDIEVTSENGVVTLTGSSQTAAAKELAGRLTANTDGVRQVHNQLIVSAANTNAAKAQQAATDAKAAISDSWITSKVKSSLLFSRDIAGMNISVATQAGQVTLGGSVLTGAERQLAIDTARNIRGVRSVKAAGLKVTG